MTECNNDSVRDLLPDLVAGTLPASAQAACKPDVRALPRETALLLARSRAAPRSGIDVARIVDALLADDVAVVHLVRSDPGDDAPCAQRRGNVPRYVPVARADRTVAGCRAAACLSGTAWRTPGDRVDCGRAGRCSACAMGPATPARLAVPPAGRARGVAGWNPPRARRSALESRRRGDRRRRWPVRPREATGRRSPWGLSEYSDEDLERMLERLEKWDGATSTDPLPTLPILSATRGTL